MSTIFTIKRFSILREKEFSQSFKTLDDFALDTVRLIQAPLNIMKSIEMWDLEKGKHIDHWLGLMVSKLTLEELISIGISPQTAFIGIEEDEKLFNKVLGANTAKKIRNEFADPLSFVNYVIHVLLNKTRSNDPSLPPKYFDKRFKSTDPKSLYYTNKDYLIIYKYIALCLSGQIDPFNVSSYFDKNIYQKIINTKVNYGIIKYKAHNDLIHVIGECIKTIYGYYPELLEFK